MNNIIFCKEPIEITRKEFDKINELMKVDFNDSDMPHMKELINTLNALPETVYASFRWEFEDGTKIIMDIESTYYAYMVKSVWYNNINDKNGYFETEYQVYRFMAFEIGDNTYVCQFEIKDEEKEEKTTKKYRVALTTTMRGYVTVEAENEEQAALFASNADWNYGDLEDTRPDDDVYCVDTDDIIEFIENYN